eukprot:gnl/Trimastix_PCT/2203.p1 GENE.gnl/Trimastix_PCT/2203~~gnl/Trimastix_PCT/2203.p1  ORF type:complete len:299 (-),score=62.67 gnl/Trimastix_PCT/2203:696-1460(-)
MESGGDCYQMGTGADAYKALDPCKACQINLWENAQMRNQTEIHVGSHFKLAASYVDLGRIEEVVIKYFHGSTNRETVYTSIHFDDGKKHLVIGKPEIPRQPLQFMQLHEADEAPLRSTRVLGGKFQPQQGHVYLVRVTKGEVTNSWDKTVLMAKIMVLASPYPVPNADNTETTSTQTETDAITPRPLSPGQFPVSLRWDVFWSSVPTGAKHTGPSSALTGTALFFGIVDLILIVGLLVVYFLFIRKKAYVPVSI